MFIKYSPQRCKCSAIHQLLLVPLDDRGRTYLGLIRILAELAPRFPLAQQIPTLIELDLDGFQPYLIVIGQFALPVEMFAPREQDLRSSSRWSDRSSIQPCPSPRSGVSGNFSVSLSGSGPVDSGSLAGNDCSMVSSSAASRRNRSCSGL